MPEEEEIIKKYKKKLGEYTEEEGLGAIEEFSREYAIFREESLSKQTTRYENLCNSIEKIVQVRPSPLKYSQLEDAIEIAHLNITPIGASSFAIFISVLSIFLGLLTGVLIFLVTGAVPFFIPLALVILGAVLLKPLTNLPIYIANRWRLKASNQMVLCILYVAMYMRHTSNLEHAIKFAAEHIQPPLSLDLRKIFWDIETGRFSNIKDSLNNYLEGWRHHNLEFINSFHLIESSLYEPSESRRLELLDKALEVMLEGTYEKMLHYAQELKNPITMLHMLGVVLPILGLVVFPLIGSFLGGLVKWYHILFLYNIILPIIVFSIGINILSKRPTGYGESELSKELMENQKKPKSLAIIIAFIFILLAFTPIIMHFINPAFDVDLGSTFGKLLNYKDDKYGPFGLAALLMSFLVPFGLALSISFYFKTKTKKLIEIRTETKELEKEFAASLFQLGTRLGDGIPAEIAFSDVAKIMEGTPTGNFFRIIDLNIRNLGMGVKEAIFNKKTGAILQYPSTIVQSSMEVLLESSKKGPQVASQSLLSISRYIERIQQVNERLKDLLSEVISSMKSQTSFLTPAIAGIVVGIASMIVNIIVQLGEKFSVLEASGELIGGTSQLSAIQGIFTVQDIIPGFFFQLVVGLYVVQLGYILTLLANGIENGDDKLNEQHLIGKNIFRSAVIYIIIAVIVVLLFNLLAVNILKGTGQL